MCLFKFVSRGLGILCLSAFSSLLQAQNSPYNKVSISTPNAASLGKYADVPVSQHTGMPQIGIPIYTISEGGINLPVSLSYHASGLKVMEQASWVGAGWSLNAGGVITRTVQGQPDERLTSGTFADQVKGHLSDGGYNSYLWQNINDQGAIYLKDIYSGKADGEPDLFFFNFAGYSGKFYFGDDKVPVVMPEQDVKIEYVYTPGIFKSIESFTLTTPDGNKYYFGVTPSTTDTDPVERSLSISNTNGYASNGRSISSWYLNKVVSADGLHTITLSYQSENYSYFNIGSGSVDEGETVNNGSDLNKISVEGVRLSTINFTNGTVDFIPDATPRQDLSGTMWSVSDDANTQAKALKEIRVTNNTGVCTKSTFSYDYFVDNTSPQVLGPVIQSDKKRLKLLSVKQESCDQTSNTPPYTFEYFGELVPRKISYSQDHWGFYNGANNLTTMIPAYRKYTIAGIEDVAGADRDSKWPAMRGGALKRVNYPTGGYTDFEFEPNTAWVSYPDYTKTLRLNFSMGYDGNNTAQTRTYTFSGNPYRITLKNTSQGGSASVFFSCSPYTALSAAPGQTTVLNNIFSAGSCNITLSKPDPMVGFGAEVIIEEMVPFQVQKNEIVGGLRIKKITNSAGPGAVPVTTDYSYNLPDGKSSGILYSKPTYVQVLKNSGSRFVYQILFGNGATWYLDAETYDPYVWPYFTAGGRSAIKSASPILPMSTTQGNHIGYNEVKVSQTGNGHSLYRFYGSNSWDFDIRDVCTRVLDIRSPNPPAPDYPAAPESFDYKRGELKYESHRDETSRLIKEVSYYPTFQSSQITTPGIRVYAVNAGPPLGMITSAITKFELNSARKTENTITERVYDPNTGNYIENTSTTLYESPYHAAATSTSSVNSKGEQLVSRIKYAFDYVPGGCVSPNTCWTDYQAALSNNLTLYNSEYNQCSDNNCRMIAKAMYQSRNMQARRNYASCRASRIAAYNSCFLSAKQVASADLQPILELGSRYINAPIENTSWKGSLLAKASFSKYDLSANMQGFPVPSKLLVINPDLPLSTAFTPASVNGNALLKDSRYTEESSIKVESGNLVEIIGKDGVTTSYIWGYSNTLPVVKAVGVTYSTLKSAYDAVAGNLSALRSQPGLAAAMVSTYVYKPGVGMLSETDPRGRTIYYEYDKMNRLSLLRDHDNNIIKKICYNYYGQAESCPVVSNLLPSWWVTGATRCKPCPANNNYITNMLQREEKDINPQSPTYNTIRWTDIGVSTTCDVNPDWQFTSTAIRCKLNLGLNTGEQEREQKDMNPCSSSYGQTRWIVVGVNYTACPLSTCNSNTCTGEDKKCINGVCQTGTKVYTASVYSTKAGYWICTYHYVWSDGSVGRDLQETSPTNCLGSSTD